MDTTFPTNLLNPLSLSSSSSSKSKQPEFLSPINELSDFSTALSAFLHDFHDLRDHITSISSAIDAQLPPHLLLNTTTTTEAIFAERNLNGTEKSNDQLTVANNAAAAAAADDDLRKGVEESNDKLLKESEEDIDLWKMIEDIDCDNNAIENEENDTSKEPDSFRKAGEICKLKGTDISKVEDRETSKYEENDISKEDGEIAMSMESHGINISKKKPREETDASKKLVENVNDILNKPGEIDVPKEPQEEIYASKKPAEIYMLNKPEEVDVLKKPVGETDASRKAVEIDVLIQPEEVHVLNKHEEIDVSKKPDEINVSNKPEEIDVSNKTDEIDSSKKPAIAELEFWCKRMNAKKIKKLLEAHISEMNLLHQEIAKALKLARCPGRLVLYSIADFSYRPVHHTAKGNQGTGRLRKKFWQKNKKPIALRQASVLLLECFVMISGDGVQITKKEREYAENAAIDWRKRIVREGGWINTEVVDARGLLLFISGFGIPDGVFSNEDLSDLIRASNVKEISNALRHSTILIPKLPEVIDWMVKNNLETEAADIVYNFGLEDKCHHETLLMKFVHNKSKDGQNGSSLRVLEEVDVLNKPEETDVSKKPDEIDMSKKPTEEIDLSNKTEKIDVSKKVDEIDASKKPAIAMLKFLCKNMNAKKLKKYVVAHIAEMNSLHQEIAKALKLARNPAKLVLEFFLKTNSQQIAALVLILECFVMIRGDGIEITKEDKEYAENAAIDWRERIIKKGGLIYMEAVDARGLLLFISGFGIPDGVFSNEDLRDLIRASNVTEISNALRHSTILIAKLPEVINWMVKNNLEIEAADIAYNFGLEVKCHPETILMTFLHNKIKDTQNGSSLQVNATTMQQLSDLKSVRRCLETHKIDPSKFLPGIKINEKIEQLEKVVNELDLKSTEEKSTLKRKEKETEFSKDLNHQQQKKRNCLSHKILPHKQNPHGHYDIRPYQSSQPSDNGYFDQNLPNNYYATTCSASSVFNAPVLPPNITSSGFAGSYGPCVYVGPVAEPMPNTNNPWPYGGQPYSIQSQAYHPYPSILGLPNYSLPGGIFGWHVPSSDLYRFADMVVERGSHRGPHAAGSSTRR